MDRVEGHAQLSSQATTYSLNGAPRLLPQLAESVEANWDAFGGDLYLTYLLGRHFYNEDVSA